MSNNTIEDIDQIYGELPQSWQLAKLEELLQSRRADLQTGPFGTMLHASSYKDQGIPVLAVQHIGNNRINHDPDMPKVDQETFGRLARYEIKKNDIIFCRKGAVERVALVTDEEDGWLQGSDCIRLRITDLSTLDPIFFSYVFCSRAYKRWITRHAHGATMPSLNQTILGLSPIPLPSVEEQREAAKILSLFDRKIENLRRQNETLEAIAQTLFKHWFVDFEFPNADGKPYKSSGGEMVPSAIGEIPAGWNVGNLGDVVKVNAESIGKGYPHKEIEYVDISSVGIGVLEGTTSYSLKKAPSRARRLVKHGDVIWSGIRPNRKSYLFIAHPPENLVVSTGFITLTPDLIPSSYLYSWVTTDSFVEYLTLNASGSAYPAVKAEHFEIAEILLPDKFNLSKFHALVDPMRDKIHQNSRQIQTLTKTRDVLLPKLMSGKLRITP